MPPLFFAFMVALRKSVSYAVLLPASLVLASCSPLKPKEAGCLSCHRGIELTSQNHDFSCIECHGGNPSAEEKGLAHRGLRGGKNPSRPSMWEEGCGKCHAYQMERLKSSIMLTNTGFIARLAKAWGQALDQPYATAPLEGYSQDGEPLKAHSVAKLETLSAEAYRKFCSACHVGYERNWGYKGQHASGCAACHFPRNDEGTYEGGDPTIRGKSGYAKTHKMEPLPGNEACFHCHNRSGRIALTYQGLVDGNNALVPTVSGLPGPRMISEVRNVHSIRPDIHHKKGMECVDCHTSREVMGDGYTYKTMNRQLEIECEDCHGSAKRAPKSKAVTREDAPPLKESGSYKMRVHFGDRMVLTSKGRMFSNVFEKKGRYVLVTKKKGVRLDIRTIMGSDEHSIVGHERLRCDACHTQAVPQCYGCHTAYDERRRSYDFIKGESLTQGGFFETEDLRTLYPFPLVVDEEGRIAPSTPGCQTLLTYIDKNGLTLFEDLIPNYEGAREFKFVPLFSHSVGEKAVGCRECHYNPAFVGLGNGLVSLKTKTITSPMRCAVTGLPLNSIMEIKNGVILSETAVSREGARPLNKQEIQSFFRANLCITCHDKPDPRVYGKNIDTARLPVCLDLADPSSGIRRHPRKALP